MNKSKRYVRIGVFVLTMFMALIILSNTVFSSTYVTKLDSSLTTTYSYANEPDDSLQIVALGNSDLSSGLIPNIIWEQCGYTSNIAAAARQTPEKSYNKLQTILKNQSPNLVIIETDMLYEDGVGGTDVGVEEKLNQMFEFLDPNAFNLAMEDHFTVFKFHDVWKHALSDEASSNINLYTHGYRYNNFTNGISFNSFMQESDAIDPLKDNDVEYMTKIVDLCNEQGIDIFFLQILSPYSWSYARHNAVAHLADAVGVDYIDTCLLVDEIGFDESKDFRDIGNHLNYYGASKLTYYICDYIDKNYQYENRQGNPDYAFWDTSCAEFKKRIK